MQNFSVEGEVHQMFRGSEFRRSDRNFTIGKTIKFRVILLKYALRLIEIRNIIEKIGGKLQVLQNFLIFGGLMGKIMNII